jgi:hypothetical protein
MQLILTHADLEAALINDLRAKGMTAFEPGKASVEFSFKRGTKELVCILDTEAKAEAPEAPKQSVVTPAATTSAPVAQAPEIAPVEVAEEPAYVAPVAETVATTAELETAGGDDDNLFD